MIDLTPSCISINTLSKIHPGCFVSIKKTIGLIIEPIKKFHAVNLVGSDYYTTFYRTKNWYCCFYLLGNEKRILLYSENIKLTRRKRKMFFAYLEFNLSLEDLKEQWWFEHINKKASLFSGE